MNTRINIWYFCINLVLLGGLVFLFTDKAIVFTISFYVCLISNYIYLGVYDYFHEIKIYEEIIKNSLQATINLSTFLIVLLSLNGLINGQSALMIADINRAVSFFSGMLYTCISVVTNNIFIVKGWKAH